MCIQRNLKNRNAVTLETRNNVKLNNYIGLLIEINNGNIYWNFSSIKWQLFQLYLNKRHSFPYRSCTAMSPWLNIPVKQSLPWKKRQVILIVIIIIIMIIPAKLNKVILKYVLRIIIIIIVTDSQVLFHNGSLLHSSSIHNCWLQLITLLEFWHTYDRFSNYSEYFYCLLASALVLWYTRLNSTSPLTQLFEHTYNHCVLSLRVPELHWLL
jgi:hypothetical protein